MSRSRVLLRAPAAWFQVKWAETVAATTNERKNEALITEPTRANTQTTETLADD